MSELIKNPATKFGDKIILLEARNGAQVHIGKILTVTSQRKTASKANFSAKDENGNTVNLYYTTPADEFIMATRENEIQALKEKNKTLTKEIEENNKKLEFLEKYESEEEFVAAKLDAILTAHANGKTKASRVNAMKEILSELKESSLL